MAIITKQDYINIIKNKGICSGYDCDNCILYNPNRIMICINPNNINKDGRNGEDLFLVYQLLRTWEKLYNEPLIDNETLVELLL